MSRSLRGVLAGVGLAAVLLLAPASAAAAPALGITPDVPSGGLLQASAAATKRLPYEGGQVLHSNRTHLIFWQPRGSGLTFQKGYLWVTEHFMANVAAASHRTSNVFSLSGQYSDSGGPAAYASTSGRSVVDTDPLPTKECAEPPVVGPGWTDCVTDSQIETELERVVHAHHLPSGPDDIYFLVTPAGLGSCLQNGPNSCALGGSQTGGYCGYHSWTSDGIFRYAVIPYNAVSGHCQSGNPRPNRSTADPTLSTISHEMSETITDPYGDAWVTSSGQEEADLCGTNYGPVIGGSGGARYDEVIHGGHYFLQEEWSNASGACQARAKPDSAFFAVTHRNRSKVKLLFTGTGQDPLGRIVTYRWSFGDGRVGFGRRVQHHFPHRGHYTVILRAVDSWRNWAFYTLRVHA